MTQQTSNLRLAAELIAEMLNHKIEGREPVIVLDGVDMVRLKAAAEVRFKPLFPTAPTGKMTLAGVRIASREEIANEVMREARNL